MFMKCAKGEPTMYDKKCANIEKLEFIRDSIQELIDKEKYFINGDSIDYKEALVKIMKDSEEYDK